MKMLMPFLLLAVTSIAGAANEIDAKVEAALAAESRPETDRVRDDNRMPLETLKFFGMQDNMRVLELLPGRGWYTRILAPVLAENGKLFVAIGTERIEEGLLREPGFDEVEVLKTTANQRRSEVRRMYLVDKFDFGVKNLDLVLTFRNLHNFDKEDRDEINRNVFKS
ncbi:MAG: methyltransferase, partial [Gammaproteobacteria bacterium]|nr:methyltransferase [Gammaproteobacteria bacterium]